MMEVMPSGTSKHTRLGNRRGGVGLQVAFGNLHYDEERLLDQRWHPPFRTGLDSRPEYGSRDESCQAQYWLLAPAASVPRGASRSRRNQGVALPLSLTISPHLCYRGRRVMI